MEITMAIKRLTAAVAAEAGLTREQAQAAVRAVFDTIARDLAAGRSLTVSNFGTFSAKVRPAGVAQNIATGERMATVAHHVPRFRATGRLRDMVRDQDATASIRKLPSGPSTRTR
ncbi:HU family DNA-binding protein [Streptomyces sp. NPDC051320]|uniref:HU family DNA-binding protein n=1 Tax=Streptomyces sp. NPDC051320 TaxID=3154644 RepID=UPI003442F1BF